MSSSADAARRTTRDRGAMTYLTNFLIPDGTMEGYGAISGALDDDRPDGMVARYVGMARGGLAITVVWASKAAADRFEVEHLEPAVRRVLGPPHEGGSGTAYAYEATEVVYGPAGATT
jgi:hypothetical protein